VENQPEDNNLHYQLETAALQFV